MKLTRYELTLDGVNNVGLIQGGYGLGIFNEEELRDINKKLPMPPRVHTNRQIDCYFTEAGNERFGYIVEIAKKNIHSVRNKLGVSLVEKNIETSELQGVDIIYKDEWQWLIRA